MATDNASGYSRERSLAALEEFGFTAVPLGEPGAPTPGRIADRLADIAAKMNHALEAGFHEQAVSALHELNRLRLSLDAWDGHQMRAIQ